MLTRQGAGAGPSTDGPLKRGGIFGIYSSFPATDAKTPEAFKCNFTAHTEMGSTFLDDVFISTEQDCQVHFGLVFNIFVMMQLFNQVNARKIYGEKNSFAGILDNKLFLLIMAAEFGGQVLMVEAAGVVFKTTGGLSLIQWGVCLVLGAGELIWNLLVVSVSEEIIPDCILNFDQKLYDKEGDVEGGGQAGGAASSSVRSGSFTRAGRAGSRQDLMNKDLQLTSVARQNSNNNIMKRSASFQEDAPPVLNKPKP